ncbi:MAG: oxalurate catabolism protein HpxZ [Roseinatronobacter sp.]
MIEINHPEALAELSAAFDAYETALVSNDVEMLDLLFWNSPHTIRYGPQETLYGHEAIHAFRVARPGAGLERRLTRTVITTFGTGWGTALTEFHRTGGARTGRQSQTWVRMPEGWRIVAAHVSFEDV